jgi:hypothetical protein
MTGCVVSQAFRWLPADFFFEGGEVLCERGAPVNLLSPGFPPAVVSHHPAKTFRIKVIKSFTSKFFPGPRKLASKHQF